MTKFYIVRHGQTDYNKRKIIQGHLDIPLNEVGIEQAKLAAKNLKDVNFDAIFYSPLLRAKRTADEILKDHLQTSFIVAPEIMERGFGDYEGKTLSAEEPFWNYALEPKLTGKNVETLEAMKERVFPFIDKVANDYKDQTVCLVCHGGVGMIIREYFEGTPSSKNLMDYPQMTNGEAMIFEK